MCKNGDTVTFIFAFFDVIAPICPSSNLKVLFTQGLNIQHMSSLRQASFQYIPLLEIRVQCLRFEVDLSVRYIPSRVVTDSRTPRYPYVEFSIVPTECSLCFFEFLHQSISRCKLLRNFCKILVTQPLPQPGLEVAIYKNSPTFVSCRVVSNT